MTDYYFGGIAMIIAALALLVMASYFAYSFATDKD